MCRLGQASAPHPWPRTGLSQGSPLAAKEKGMRPRAGRSGVQKRQILALMKVPPQQILAAVGTAVCSGAPCKPNSGGTARLASPDGAHWASGLGQRETRILGEPGAGPVAADPQFLDLDPSGLRQPAHPAPHLPIPAEAGPGADAILPESTLGPLGFQVRGRAGHMNPQTSALKVAVEKCVSFPV